MSTLDPQRRSALLGAKLAALVGRHEPAAFPGGAASREGATGWVLVDAAPERGLGGAVAWGLRAGLDELYVLTDRAPAPGGGTVPGLLARRAAAFAHPATAVLSVGGTSAELAEAEPLASPVPPPAAALSFADAIEAAGAEVVVEHGVVTAEVLGLEVGRVLTDEEHPVLAVGVGKHDREAHLMVGDALGSRTLADAVAAVLEHRRADAAPHPANQLSVERWLRAAVCARPEVVGATVLEPTAPPLPRTDLRQVVPAPATGFDAAGRPLVAVCSVGVDLDLVPTAVDARAAWGGPDGASPRLVLVVPEGDDHPATSRLAAALRLPAEVGTVGRDWRAW